MRRKLLLPALAACTMLAISAPVAPAKTHTAFAASTASLIKAIQNINLGQTAAINRVDARVDKVVATLGAITAGVPAIVDGLTKLQAALEDPVTGLVGLNHARPQFGAFDGGGIILGGTGQTSGASGPKNNAVNRNNAPAGLGGANISGLYVVDFGNDVSKRVYWVNVFPLGPASLGGGAVATASAINCSSKSSVATLCGAVANTTTPDFSQNHVLVQYGSGSAGGAPNGFTVTAVSG